MDENIRIDGSAIKLVVLSSNCVEVCFDRLGEPMNKLDAETLEQLEAVVAYLEQLTELDGVMITSAKDTFIVGADIKSFGAVFTQPAEDVLAMLHQINGLFSRIEDLPCPTVAAINGLALGGGFELCLSTDLRVMADDAKVGLPEVKLGIFPGWGGTVRLPRMIGADNAIEWICSGNEKRSADALRDGAVDAVVSGERLRDAALDLLAQAHAGKVDYKNRREEKQQPLKLGQLDCMMAFETAKGFIAGKAGPHYPAPVAVVMTMQKHAGLGRDAALVIEANNFVKVAQTPVCRNLVGLFLNDQLIKKIAGGYRTQAVPVKQAAVLGAGIMGGGIAYQSASKGTPILMKDINEPALQAGLGEAAGLLNKQIERKRMTPLKMAQVLGAIRPTLSYDAFKSVDLVVEAVVENPKVKQAVLMDVEDQVSPETILTSNTSTIAITHLASALKRPENFCGMHFFNPVHRMPLVEVIRGAQSSERAVATAVAYALSMGKTPIVVNDCPGFLVNRVLFPYFAGFNSLLESGVDFARIDRVMEGFGWPMGPAYLSDVVGLDTAVHAQKVMAQGFPDRMGYARRSVIEILVDNKRLGQKNTVGFYRYEKDRRGKLQKKPDASVTALIAGQIVQTETVSDEQIVQRMMTPLCIELVRCLEDSVVASPAEADMGLVYGIGFPPFRGGALRYIDDMGMDAFCQQADHWSALGALYHPTADMRKRAVNNQSYHV